MKDDPRYQQLALFSVIVAEMVITPSVLGGAAYYLTKERPFLGLNWMFWSTLGLVLGLLVAFFRVYKMFKKTKTNDEPK